MMKHTSNNVESSITLASVKLADVKLANITKNNISKNNISKNNVAKNNVAKNNVAKNNVAKNNVAEVLIESPSFSFNCAHFIAYKGYKESLHGHNYNVSLKIKGSIQEDGYVIDFDILKKIVNDICKTLDHRFILPIYSDVLQIKEVHNNFEIICEDNSLYSFPQKDCVLIPIKHSSVEEIGQYILDKIIESISLSFLKKKSVNYVEVSVGESPTQKAILHQHI
ncbi:6-pyruvoyltetrahydropterin synthase, putative [Hepatocystis sp. ex Piliocolobus tephrosceles]|nr:6-pyruvoyltetrahydropterin synthase, putative [Hepatocystis sp. ex Piliocolobus tephrosceles]